VLPGTNLYVENPSPLDKQYPIISPNLISNHFQTIKKDLTNIFHEEGETPISMSRILVYFLKMNSGALHPALGDMTGFFKYMARSELMHNAPSRPIDWLGSHVRDQLNRNFSLNNFPPLEELPKGEIKDSVISIWGLMYHIPNLVYLLSYFSPNIVRSAATIEYISSDHVAEAYKVKVDGEVVNSLNDIFSYLQNFKPTG